jgi:DNA-binding transcriptional regulator YiaG
VVLSDGVQVVEIITNVEFNGGAAMLHGLHIQGSGPSTLGPGTLRKLANWTKVQLDVDQLRIEGATRTSWPVRDVSRPALSSDETVVAVLHRTGALDKGVSVARRLDAAGLTLKQAHDAINKLAARDWTSCVVAKSENLQVLASDLAIMNVELRRKRSGSGEVVDVAEMRARRGLSQREYADLLGLDVRTLQNWEQGRNRPDPAAVSLMRIFDRAPDRVEEALTEAVI